MKPELMKSKVESFLLSMFCLKKVFSHSEMIIELDLTSGAKLEPKRH